MPTHFPSRASKTSELSIEGIQVVYAKGLEVVAGTGLEVVVNNASGLEVVHKHESSSQPESRKRRGLKSSPIQRYLLPKKNKLLWFGTALAFTIGISAAVIVTWVLSRKEHFAR